MGVEGVEGVRQPIAGVDHPLEVGFEEAPEGLFEIDHAGCVADSGSAFGDDVEAGELIEDEAGKDDRELARKGQPGARRIGSGSTPDEQETRDGDCHGDGRVADLDEGAKTNGGHQDASAGPADALEGEERDQQRGGKEHHLERVPGVLTGWRRRIRPTATSGKEAHSLAAPGFGQHIGSDASCHHPKVGRGGAEGQGDRGYGVRRAVMRSRYTGSS